LKLKEVVKTWRYWPFAPVRGRGLKLATDVRGASARGSPP